MEIYLANDNLLELIGLKDAVTDTYINNATVTAILKNAATGEELTGQTWPISLSYIASSNGDYRATIEYDVAYPAIGQKIHAEITVDAGAGRRAFFKPIVTVAERRAS